MKTFFKKTTLLSTLFLGQNLCAQFFQAYPILLRTSLSACQANENKVNASDINGMWIDITNLLARIYKDSPESILPKCTDLLQLIEDNLAELVAESILQIQYSGSSENCFIITKKSSFNGLIRFLSKYDEEKLQRITILQETLNSIEKGLTQANPNISFDRSAIAEIFKKHANLIPVPEIIDPKDAEYFKGLAQ